MNPIDKALFHILQRCGLIAILRGVQPHEVVAIGHALYDAGFRIIEVPLNSPEPLASIRALRDALPADCLVGAGTVLSIEAVADVAAAGGQIIVMPHSNPDVIRAARAAGMACAPGVATLTEAYAALAAGANMLKLFPAEALPPHVLLVLDAAYAEYVRRNDYESGMELAASAPNVVARPDVMAEPSVYCIQYPDDQHEAQPSPDQTQWTTVG